MSRTIQYCFELPGNVTHEFSFSLDSETFQIETEASLHMPEWTRLEYHRCSHCPVYGQDHCPVAVNICNIVLPLEAAISFETVTCRVVVQERTCVITTSAQEAIYSLLLVVIAASSCPYTDFLKPMARFHLPFPTVEETVARIVSTSQLLQYFRKDQGHTFDPDLGGLYEICKNIEIIGVAVAERLKASEIKGDAGSNALVIFHHLSQIVPIHVENHLDIIRPAFKPALNHYDICRAFGHVAQPITPWHPGCDRVILH